MSWLFIIYVLLISIKSNSSFKHIKTILKRNQYSHICKSSNRVIITPDEAITKEIVLKGQGKLVETGDILAIEYSARVEGESTPFAKGDQEKFVFKDGTLIKGWDIGVSSMKIGERAKIFIGDKYGYGAKGIDGIIPPNSNIEIDIRILAWLGNQLNPESLFSKDLDIDPFVSRYGYDV